MTIDWEIRKDRIGASDIGAIAGLSRWKTPFDVWLEATRKSAPFAGNENTEWGIALEPVIAARYARDNNVELVECETIIHPKHDLICGTPDRLAKDDCDLGLEIKTANWRMASEWGEGIDEIPEAYIAQCAIYMSITGRPRWDLAVLIGGTDYRVYHLHRDIELEEGLIELAIDFWRDHIKADIPPPINGSESASKWLASRFPRANKNLIDSTPEIDALALRLRDVRQRKDDAEEEEALLKNQLKERIGGGLGINGEWGTIRWIEKNLNGKTDWEAVAKGAGASRFLIEQHTSQPKITRAFTPKFKE
jgi:putative phage-type endonuclease